MKKVLIIGAGFLQTFIIRRAKELGYDTYVVDKNKKSPGFEYADHYATIDIIDEEACLKYARENEVDGVLTAATDYGVLTAAYIAQELKLNGINYETAKCIKNKYLVRARLLQKGVGDITQFFEIHDLQDIEDIKDEIEYPIMVKPCDGSGSKGAGKVDNYYELRDTCEEALNSSLSKKVLLETFITGREYGAESFVLDGKVNVLAIMQKTMTEPPFYAELGHNVPNDLPTEVEERVKEIVKNTIEALGINFGAVNMDMLITENYKVSIVDIGARMGGNLIGSHIIPMATGIDYMGNIIRASVGDKCGFEQKESGVVATALLALNPGIVEKLPDYDDVIRQCNLNEIYCHLTEGDEIRLYKNNLDGCGYVVTTGDTVQEAREQAFVGRDMIDRLIVRREV